MACGVVLDAGQTFCLAVLAGFVEWDEVVVWLAGQKACAVEDGVVLEAFLADLL